MKIRGEDGDSMDLRNVGILYVIIRCHNQKMEAAWTSETLVFYTSLLGVTTWRWRQHGSPKHWYPTSLQRVTTWRWRQHGPAKHWYPIHQYMASPLEDGGSIELRNVGILPHHYMASQPEDGGRMNLRNFGIVYTTTRRHNPEDRDFMCIRLNLESVRKM